MNRRPATCGFSRFFRVHERKLVAMALIGLALFGGIASIGVLASKIRIPALDAVERIINYWDDRWSRRVEYGERLVGAKEYPQAVEYLVTLDRAFPAQNVRHKRDVERERLLRALGRSYSELGKKRLALDTYRRLVEFDPRNFENRYLLAQAGIRFGEPKLAEEHLAGVLKIHPTHLPSVRAVLRMHFDKGDFADVVTAYETYLNAFLIQHVTVALGQSSIKVNVPVDGRFHDVDVRLTHLPETSGELVVQVGEFAIEIKQLTLEAPLVVGAAGVPITRVWPGETSWQVQEMAPIGAGIFRALGPGATLRLDVPPQPRGVAEIHLRLRLFKPIDPEMWSMVTTSYQRLLRYDDLKVAQSRSVTGISNGND
jgi:tetratricopeptide (TPR) repeat protein